MKSLINIMLIVAAGLMVHPATIPYGQVLLLLSTGLMVFGAEPAELNRAVVVGAVGAVAVGVAGLSAAWENLDSMDVARTLRSLAIPLACMLATMLGWRRFRAGLWGAAVVHGLGYTALAIATVYFSAEYFEPGVGMVGGEGRKFQKLFDPMSVIYAPALSSMAFGAVVAGGGFFLSRNRVVRVVSLLCTAAIVTTAMWLGNKSATYSVVVCSILAYLVASRGAGSLTLKALVIVGSMVMAWAAFSERFADSKRMARLTDDWDSSFTGRTAVWRDALPDVGRYPFGVTIERWQDELGFSEHNTPLQVIRVFGWIPGSIFAMGYCVLALTPFLLWRMGGPYRSRYAPFVIAAAWPCCIISGVESVAMGPSGTMYGLCAMTGFCIIHATAKHSEEPITKRAVKKDASFHHNPNLARR